MDSGTIEVLIADDQAMVRYGLALVVDHEPGLSVVAQAGTGREAIAAARRLRPDIVLMDIRMPDLDGIAATAEIRADPALAETQVLVLTTFDDEEYVFGALRAGAAGFLLKDVAPQDLVDAIRRVHDGDSLLDPGITRKVIETYLGASGPATGPARSGSATPGSETAGAAEPGGGGSGATALGTAPGAAARGVGTAGRDPRSAVSTPALGSTISPAPSQGAPAQGGASGGFVAADPASYPEATDLALARLTGREGDVWRLVAEGMSNREIGRKLGIAETTVKAHVTSLLVKLGVSSRVQAVILAYDVGLVVPGC